MERQPMAVVAGGAAAATSPGAPGSAPRYICFLCKRKFTSTALLTKHKQLSELHRRNLAKQDAEILEKKEESRQAMFAARKQLQELELAISKQAPPEDETQALQGQRRGLELKFRQTATEYGSAQEKLEASRHQQVIERSAGVGSLPLKPSEVHETRLGRLFLSAGAASWQGNRDVQEDRYILDISLEAPDGQKVIGFAVMDGHSGSLCVDALMEWLPRNLQKCLSTKAVLNEDNLRMAVTEMCVLTDDQFLSKARKREVLDGSTMLMCLIFHDESRTITGEGGMRIKGAPRLLIANLGDSRAVLCRTQGDHLSAVRLSDDHKPGRADERRRIEAKGGVVDMQGVWRVFTPGPANFGGRSLLWGLAVSRAFGDILMKEPQRYGCAGATGELITAMPEIHVYDLHATEDRFLIIACDGIWDVLGDDDAVSVCIDHRSADLAAHALVRRAFEIGSDDNLTALVIAWRQDAEVPSSESGGGGPQLKRARAD